MPSVLSGLNSCLLLPGLRGGCERRGRVPSRMIGFQVGWNRDPFSVYSILLLSAVRIATLFGFDGSHDGRERLRERYYAGN